MSMKSDTAPTLKGDATARGVFTSREADQMNAGRTRLYLVRHGELVTSQEWRYVGHMDVDLNDAGILQLERLAQRLHGERIDALFSSDLKRTVRSAQIIGRAFGLTPVLDRAFREIDLGRWEGLTQAEIIERFRCEFEARSLDIANYRIEGGESFADMQGRVIPALTSCLERNQGKNIMLVAHGGVNRVILCHALGLDLSGISRLDQTYGCLNIIDFFDGVPVVRLVNETPSGLQHCG